MLPDEVRKAVERMDACIEITEPQHTVFCGDKDTYLTIRAHLLAREAEVERLQAIEKERWDVVATRNAAVTRAERAEALLREAIGWNWLDDDAPQQAGVNEDNPSVMDKLYLSITAHLSENSRG